MKVHKLLPFNIPRSRQISRLNTSFQLFFRFFEQRGVISRLKGCRSLPYSLSCYLEGKNIDAATSFVKLGLNVFGPYLVIDRGELARFCSPE
jgi:hypothetical protein